MDWFGYHNTYDLVTGWCMFLDDTLTFWKSKKKDGVSKSSPSLSIVLCHSHTLRLLGFRFY